MVFHQGGLSSGWSGLWSFFGVVSRHGGQVDGLSSGWSLIRVVSRKDDLSGVPVPPYKLAYTADEALKTN